MISLTITMDLAFIYHKWSSLLKKTENVQGVINDMVYRLGLTSEKQLCDFLGISQSSASKWKTRGSMPSKYTEQVKRVVEDRRKSVEIISKITVSTAEVAQALGMTGEKSIYKYKSRNPHVYKIIEDGIRMEKAL